MNPINLVVNVINNASTEINKIISSASSLSSTFTSLTSSISSTISAISSSLSGFSTSMTSGISSAISSLNSIITSFSTSGVAAFTPFFTSVSSGFSSFLSSASTTFSTINSTISTQLSTINAAVAPIVSSISSNFSTISSNVSATFSSISSTISTRLSAINAAVAPIVNSINTNFSTISSNVSAAFSSVNSTISTRLSAINAAVAPIVNSISSSFSSISTSVTSTFSRINSTISGFVSSIPHIPSFVPKTANDEIIALAKTLGKSYDEAEKFAKSLGMTGSEAKKAIERLKELKEVNTKSGMQFKTLQSELGVTSDQFKKLNQASGGGQGGFLGFLKNGFEFASKHFLLLQQGIEMLGSVSSQAWDKMVMQNETLQKSILQSSTSLVSTARIFSNGLEIKNTTEAIKTLEPAMRKSLDQIAKDSLDIVGVTSAQLTDVFQVLLTNSSSLINQSKTMADPLKAATKQTSLWAATLGTMGLPLAQARQEIGSIYSQQIDVNSTVAKNLGITNQMVGAWKAQGKLVDELNKRLQPFVEGNALAAKSIDGIGSNLTEIIELSTRIAGEPVYKFVVDTMQKFYDWAAKQQTLLTDTLSLVGTTIADAGKAAIDALGPAFKQIGEAAEHLLPTIGRLIAMTINGVSGFLQLTSPVIEAIGKITVKASEAVDMLTRMLLMGKIKDADQFLDDQFQQVTQISNNVTSLNGQYLALEKKKQSGIKLTSQEIQQQKQLKVGIAAQSERLTQMQTTMKAFVPITAEQRTRMDGIMADIDRNSNTLVRTGMAGVSLMGKLAPEVGSAYKQMGDKVDGAIEKLKKAEGSTEEFNGNAKTVVDITKQQLQLGYISREEAAKRFKFIATNTRASSENQLAAQKELDAVLKKSADDKVDDIVDAENKIQALTKAGRLSQAEGERQLTNEKIKETKERLKNVASEITEEERLRKKDITEQVKQLEKSLKAGNLSKDQTEKVKQQITQLKKLEVSGTSDKLDELKKQQKKYQNELITTEAQSGEQRNKEKLKDFEEQLSIAKSQNDQKLLTEHDFNQKNLNLTTAQGKEELKQIADKRKKLAKTDKEGLEALLVEEGRIRAKMFQASEKFLADELKSKQEHNQRLLQIEQSLLDRQLVSSEDFENKSHSLSNQRIKDELASIAQEKKMLPASGKARAEGLEKLNAKEAEIRGKAAKADREHLQNLLKIKLEHLDRINSISTAARDRDLISTQDFNSKSIALSRQRTNEELKEIQKEKALLPKSGSGRAEVLEKLNAKEAEIRAKAYKSEQGYLENQLKTKLEHYDRVSQISTVARDRDLISTQDFNSKSIALSRQRTNEELKEIQKEKALLPKSGSGRTEALEKLNVKEAEIRAKAYKSEQEYLENQLKTKLEHYDRIGQIQNSKLSLQLISTQDFNSKSITLDRQRFAEELKTIQKEKALLPKSGSGRAEVLEKLNAKETEIRAKAYKAEQEYLANQLKFQTDHLDRLGQINQAKLDLQLSSTTEFNNKSIQLERQRTAAELDNIEKQRQRIPKAGTGRLEALEKLATQELAIKARSFKAEQTNIENQLKAETDHQDRITQIRQSALDQQLVSQSEFNAQSIQLARQRAAAELEAIDKQRKLVPQGAGRAEALEKLATREAQIRATWFKQEQQFNEAEVRTQTEHLDRVTQIQQAKLDRQVITAEEFANKSLDIERQRSSAELAFIEAERQRINSSKATPAAKLEALEKLAVREEGIRSRLYKSEQQSSDAQLKARTDHYDRLLALDQAKFDQRQINEVQFAKKSLELNKAKANEELKAIESERSRITATGAARTEALEKLAVREAQIKAKINKESDELTDKLRQNSLYKLETAQKKATDIILQSEVERQIAQQKLINSGLLKKEDTEAASLESTRDKIKAELSAEKDKLAALVALPKYQDPKREEQHQADIRASRRRTSELTLELLKNEEAQQENLRKQTIKKLDEYLAKLSNSTEAQVQDFQRYIKAVDAANKALETQLKLKSAEKELQTALDDSVQRNFKFLQETAKTDDEKKRLAEQAAKASLDARLKQFHLEQDSLELQIKQTEFAQRRLEIENQIAIAKNKAEQAKDQVAILKAKANKATPEELKALELTLQARVEEGSSLQDAKNDLASQRNLLKFFNEVKRTNLDVTQSGQYHDAQYNWAKSIVNDAEREKQINLIRQDAQIALKSEQTPGGTFLSQQIAEAQKLQENHPGYYDFRNRRFNFGDARRYDPEYRDFISKQQRAAQPVDNLLIGQSSLEQLNQRFANLSEKERQDPEYQRAYNKAVAAIEAQRNAYIKDKSVISPVPGLKLNVPERTAQENGFNKVVAEIIKLQDIVKTTAKPNVKQEFNQNNHFVGDNNAQALISKSEDQWRKGMVQFIDALNRV